MQNEIANGPPRVSDRFTVGSKLGQGTFSYIYEAYDGKLNKNVALKIEKRDKSKNILKFEYQVLSNLKGLQHVPNAYDFIHMEQSQIVMDLLGINLAKARRCLDQRYDLKVAIQILKEMVYSLQEVHQRGFIHRDVKASNFVLDKENRHVYIVDFGLAKKHLDCMNVPVRERSQADFRGTVSFASLNAHNSIDLSRRDDIWSLYFTMLDFLNEKLEWREQRDFTITQVKEIKTKCLRSPKKRLWVGPTHGVKEVEEILNHINSLQYVDEPDYYKIIKLLLKIYNNYDMVRRPNTADQLNTRSQTTNTLDNSVKQGGNTSSGSFVWELVRKPEPMYANLLDLEIAMKESCADDLSTYFNSHKALTNLPLKTPKFVQIQNQDQNNINFVNNQQQGVLQRAAAQVAAPSPLNSSPLQQLVAQQQHVVAHQHQQSQQQQVQNSAVAARNFYKHFQSQSQQMQHNLGGMQNNPSAGAAQQTSSNNNLALAHNISSSLNNGVVNQQQQQASGGALQNYHNQMSGSQNPGATTAPGQQAVGQTQNQPTMKTAQMDPQKIQQQYLMQSLQFQQQSQGLQSSLQGVPTNYNDFLGNNPQLVNGQNLVENKQLQGNGQQKQLQSNIGPNSLQNPSFFSLPDSNAPNPWTAQNQQSQQDSRQQNHHNLQQQNNLWLLQQKQNNEMKGQQLLYQPNKPTPTTLTAGNNDFLDQLAFYSTLNQPSQHLLDGNFQNLVYLNQLQEGNHNPIEAQNIAQQLVQSMSKNQTPQTREMMILKQRTSLGVPNNNQLQQIWSIPPNFLNAQNLSNPNNKSFQQQSNPLSNNFGEFNSELPPSQPFMTPMTNPLPVDCPKMKAIVAEQAKFRQAMRNNKQNCQQTSTDIQNALFRQKITNYIESLHDSQKQQQMQGVGEQNNNQVNQPIDQFLLNYDPNSNKQAVSFSDIGHQAPKTNATHGGWDDQIQQYAQINSNLENFNENYGNFQMVQKRPRLDSDLNQLNNKNGLKIVNSSDEEPSRQIPEIGGFGNIDGPSPPNQQAFRGNPHPHPPQPPMGLQARRNMKLLFKQQQLASKQTQQIQDGQSKNNNNSTNVGGGQPLQNYSSNNNQDQEVTPNNHQSLKAQQYGVGNNPQNPLISQTFHQQFQQQFMHAHPAAAPYGPQFNEMVNNQNYDVVANKAILANNLDGNPNFIHNEQAVFEPKNTPLMHLNQTKKSQFGPMTELNNFGVKNNPNTACEEQVFSELEKFEKNEMNNFQFEPQKTKKMPNLHSGMFGNNFQLEPQQQQQQAAQLNLMTELISSKKQGGGRHSYCTNQSPGHVILKSSKNPLKNIFMLQSGKQMQIYGGIGGKQEKQRTRGRPPKDAKKTFWLPAISLSEYRQKLINQGVILGNNEAGHNKQRHLNYQEKDSRKVPHPQDLVLQNHYIYWPDPFEGFNQKIFDIVKQKELLKVRKQTLREQEVGDAAKDSKKLEGKTIEDEEIGDNIVKNLSNS